MKFMEELSLFKEKICVYPFGRSFVPVLNHIEMMNRAIEITALVSPKGWGLVGNTYDNGRLHVASDFKNIPSDIDILLIPGFEQFPFFEDKAVERILEVVSQFKRVISYHKFSKKNEELLRMTLHNNFCLYETFPDTTGFKIEPTYASERILPINTPILAIAEMLDGTDAFEVGLALRAEFTNMGYKVVQIGSRPYCDVVGGNQIPNFMRYTTLSEVEKVFQFNRYVKYLSEKEDPDLIILNVPDAIQSYDEKHTVGFGILPYLIFKAVRVDFLIVCSIFYQDSPEIFEIINQACTYKFDTSVGLFHMSGLRFDIEKMERSKILYGEYLDSDTVDKYIEKSREKYKIPIMNLKNNANISAACELVIESLSK